MNKVRFSKMARMVELLFLACVVVCRAEDLSDFEFESDADEVMIAQESRHYQTIVKPPVRIFKPSGVTNSHRPQYNLDSLEHYDFEDFLPVNNVHPLRSLVKNYKSSAALRAKDRMANEAVKRAIERKDHVGKFAQILPIIRAMSSSQRLALASLVANQVTTPPGRAPMNLAQVRSMFGNTNNTDLMLPILLDMANLVRRAIRPGKEIREISYKPHTEAKPNILRGFYTGEIHSEGKTPILRGLYTETHTEAKPNILRGFYTGETQTEEKTPTVRGLYTETHTEGKKSHMLRRSVEDTKKLRRSFTEDSLDDDFFDVGVEPAPTTVTHRIPQRNTNTKTNTEKPKTKDNSTKVQGDKNSTMTTTTTEASPMMKSNISRSFDNSSHDLMADSTNQTLASDLPVAEKLRALNRYVDRKGTLIRRGTYPPKYANISTVTRRTTADPGLRRRPTPPRKLPLSDHSKCELFTNSLCLHAEDYPTEAIVQSIRRNKAAAGALLADFKDPGEGALDGVTAAQESKYTAEHYLVSTNRRGDTANRDFASAGEAGFMCPSTVKYARPQRARATSGQWKYIVNTGEHTQTLRLEKCLKPKESCTYLTDNFKSKCVQVYNYHRLLTWDQQNGLHMDIFKVPTCCSCHIEGYSVNFPPVGHRIHETSSEHFPGEDLSSEHGNHAFEAVQSSIQRPTISKNPPFSLKKPESYPPFDTTQNLISGVPFSKNKIKEEIEESDPMDSYGNSYFPDSFNQASSIRHVRRPSSARSPVASDPDSMTLPSYLEPPIPSATNTFTIVKESPNKYKSNPSQFKRGAFRPSRRPIRKKIGGPDDQTSSGSSAVESYSNSNLETMEDFNDYIHEPQIGQASVPVTDHKVVVVTIAPKLHAAPSEKTSTKTHAQTHTHRIQEQKQSSEENITSENKRINYNYHPIIDFFETEGKEDESIDREDIEPTFVPSVESEWKPINHLPTRNIPSTNQVGRKKHR